MEDDIDYSQYISHPTQNILENTSYVLSLGYNKISYLYANPKIRLRTFCIPIK